MFPKFVGVLLIAVTGSTARANPPDADVIGTWEVAEFVYEGKALTPEQLAQGRATITKERMTIRLPKVPDGTVDLTYSRVVGGIDLLAADDEPEFDPLPGVWELKDGLLRIAFSNHPQDGDRPKSARAGKGVTYFALRKVRQ